MELLVMPEITIKLGEELFGFASFNDWVNNAQYRFDDAGVGSSNVLCVDSYGRIMEKGAEFMRARDENTFPARVFKRLC